jgi:HPt (histidine-containing phosphotransfer) domain-containing protein
MSDAITVRVDRRIADLLPKFLADCRREAANARRAAAAGDWASARQIGHTLHGAGGGFRLEEISSRGAEIERAAREANGAQLERSVDRLEDYLRRVRPVAE